MIILLIYIGENGLQTQCVYHKILDAGRNTVIHERVRGEGKNDKGEKVQKVYTLQSVLQKINVRSSRMRQRQFAAGKEKETANRKISEERSHVIADDIVQVISCIRSMMQIENDRDEKGITHVNRVYLVLTKFQKIVHGSFFSLTKS